MGMKYVELKNKGMLRDLSVGFPSNEYAFENRNMRITPVDRDNLLALSNEKGTKKVDIAEYQRKNITDDEGTVTDVTLEPTGELLTIQGTVLGSCVLNEYLVLFTHSVAADRIYRIELTEDGYHGFVLYSGDLNFSSDNPIETLAYYESLDIQKVYWVDGRNQPRFINIVDITTRSDPNTFNFVSIFDPNSEITVEKQYSGQGMFSPGVVQYCFTYYNKYGQQSNIVKWTALNYISDQDKANAADDYSNCSFKITLTNLDTRFDYARVYALIRTSLDGTPSAYIVGDVEPIAGKAQIVDTGTYSQSIDPTMLLYVGGREIVASTLTQKDNTLFLGNIEVKDSVVDETLLELINDMRKHDEGLGETDSSRYTKFINSSTLSNPLKYAIPYYDASSYYPYQSQLSEPSNVIKIFKGGNKYRIGIRFYTDTGASTQIYWLGDIINRIYPERSSNNVLFNRAVVQCNFSEELKSYLSGLVGTSGAYSAAELFMAEASDTDRAVVCQGVINPTLFNVKNRYSNSPYSIPSWFYRFKGGSREFGHYEKLPNSCASYTAPKNEEEGGRNWEAVGTPNTNAEIQGSAIVDYDTPFITEEFEDSLGDAVSAVRYTVIMQRSEPPNSANNTEGGVFASYVETFKNNAEGKYNWIRSASVLVFPGKDRFRWNFNDAYWYFIDIFKSTFPELSKFATQMYPENRLRAIWDALSGTADAGRAYRNRYAWAFNNWNSGDRHVMMSSGDKKESMAWPLDNHKIPENADDITGGDFMYVFKMTASGGAGEEYRNLMTNEFFIDSSIVTMDSPEITLENQNKFNNLKFRAVGYVEATSVLSDYSVNAETSLNGERVILQNNFSQPNIYSSPILGVCAFPLWQDNVTMDTNTMFWMYPWHKSGSISKYEVKDSEGNGTGEYYSVLNKNSRSNLFYCYRTTYFDYDDFWNPENGIGDTKFVSGETGQIYTFDKDNGVHMYQSDMDTVLAYDKDHEYPIINTDNYDTSTGPNVLEMTAALSSITQDPIPIQFKSNSHVLFSFTSTTMKHNSEDIMADITIPWVNYGIRSSGTYELADFDGYPSWNDSSDDDSIVPASLFTQEGNRAYLQVLEQGSGYIDIMDDPDTISSLDPVNWLVLVAESTGNTFNVYQITDYEVVKEKMPVPSLSVSSDIPAGTITYNVIGNVSNTHVISIDRQSVNGGDWTPVLEETEFVGDKTDTVESELITYGYNYRVIAYTKATDEDYIKSDDVVRTISAIGGVISVVPASFLSVGNDELQYTVTVNCTEPWHCTDKQGLTVTPDSGNGVTGSAQVTVTRTANQSNTDYALKFTTDYSKAETTLNISVVINSFLEVSPDSMSFSATSGSQSLNIECNENWTIEAEEAIQTISLMSLAAAAPEPRESKRIRLTVTEYHSSSNLRLEDSRFSTTYYYDVSTKELYTPQPSVIYAKINILPGKGSNDTGEPTNYLILGELYRDFTGNEYGGTDEYALQNNTFIPIGEKLPLTDIYSDGILGTEGDAYFQRWDNVKTEPYGEDCQNNVVEMISFMVETYQNIDGRYDSLRGLQNNLSTTGQRINQINPVYSQANNFITGHSLDNKFALSNFPSQITWSNTKTPTEDIDSWTNITLASTLDMDGDKGPVRALRRLNNAIISFQDKGIAEILFNTRTQMATTQGVPVELANSGKVDGKRYVNDKSGCINKWSIIETANGVYYMDSVNSSISLLSEQSVSLSNNKGFKSWMAGKNSVNIWDPESWDTFKSFYDRSNDDVYFMDGTEALCYNEQLSEFTSFYDYAKVPVMVNLQDRFVAVKDGSLWEMHEGDYGSFFGQDYPFSVEYKVTPDPYGDKTYSHVTYKADMFSGDTLTDSTFDSITAWNEYQKGTELIVYSPFDISNMKKKFRTWRVQVPRDTINADTNKYGLNRMRNPWLRLKLVKDTNLDRHERMQIYNMQLNYIE